KDDSGPAAAPEATAAVGTLVPGPGAPTGITEPEAPPVDDGGSWDGQWSDGSGGTGATQAVQPTLVTPSGGHARVPTGSPSAVGDPAAPHVTAERTFPEQPVVAISKGRRGWWLAGAAVALAAVVGLAALVVPG